MSHQPDERDLFRRLGADAERAHLAAPEELRRTSDRRTAVRAALGSVAVVVAVGGVLVGGNALSGSAAPDIADTPTPTVTSTGGPPTPEPTPEPTPIETASVSPPEPTETTGAPTSPIPEEAWLDSKDLRFGISHKGKFEPPSLCGRPLVAQALVDEGLATVDGTRDGIYEEPDPEYDVPEGTTHQTIVLLNSTRAADQLMDDVVDRVAACPEDTTYDDPSQVTYRLVSPVGAQASDTPDRELLIDVSTSYELYWEIAPQNGPDRFDTFISVVRVGDAISFLEVHAWEAGDTTLEEVRRLVGPTTANLREWRG